MSLTIPLQNHHDQIFQEKVFIFILISITTKLLVQTSNQVPTLYDKSIMSAGT